MKYLLLLFIICFAGCGDDDSHDHSHDNDVTSGHTASGIPYVVVDLTRCDGQVTEFKTEMSKYPILDLPILRDGPPSSIAAHHKCSYDLDNNQIYLFNLRRPENTAYTTIGNSPCDGVAVAGAQVINEYEVEYEGQCEDFLEPINQFIDDPSYMIHWASISWDNLMIIIKEYRLEGKNSSYTRINPNDNYDEKFLVSTHTFTLRE